MYLKIINKFFFSLFQFKQKVLALLSTIVGIVLFGFILSRTSDEEWRDYNRLQDKWLNVFRELKKQRPQKGRTFQQVHKNSDTYLVSAYVDDRPALNDVIRVIGMASRDTVIFPVYKEHPKHCLLLYGETIKKVDIDVLHCGA